MRKTLAAILGAMLMFSGAMAMAGNGAQGAEVAMGPQFAGGSGTIGDPFQISNVTQLQWMGNATNLDKHFVLMNDIDASATVGWNWNAGESRYDGFVPVGTDADRFTGNLDGGNRTISGLYINRTGEDYIGLFGCIGVGGSVSNVGLIDVRISGRNFVGGFAGESWGNITNCYSTGDVSGNNYTGGFAGRNGGTITNSYSTGDASGNGWVGGFAGWTWAGISNCYSTGSANGNNYVGGFAGDNSGDITDCYSIGKASGNDWVGGFAGSNWGAITNCSSTGNAVGNNYTGGFAGTNWGGITDCYSTGNASGNNYVGGFVGWNWGGTITNCYSTGKVSGNDWVGGFVGGDWGGTITNCSSTGNASGSSDVGGFVGRNDDGTITNCSSIGNVSGTSLYLGGFAGWNSGGITNCSSMGNVNGNYGVGGFAGSNHGGITNCSSMGNVNGTDNVIGGFVGENFGGTITNCYSTGNAGGEYSVGGFAGYTNGGTITDCYSTGDASGNDWVGGFAGYNNGGITNCYSTGDARGNNYAGGFAGFNRVTITNCYSTGNASAIGDFVGGFAGDNWGAITNCYSTGNASGTSSVGGFAGENTGTISGCFWDTETSGMATSAAGIGKTTQDMMNVFTFLNAGWDFNNIWGIKHTFTYPYFLRDEWVAAPMAFDDYYSTSANLALQVNPEGILANDEHWDYMPLAVDSCDALSARGATVAWTADGGFTYDPTGVLAFVELGVGESLLDSFNYTVTDGSQNDTATVHITVMGVNDAPVAGDASYATDEDTLLNIAAPGLLANATDADANDTLSIVPDTFQTNKGATVVISASGAFTYDPRTSAELQALAVGEFAHDSFTYIVDDGNGGMDTGKVTVTVNGTNDAPTISTSNDGEAVEGQAYTVDYDALDIDTSDVLVWTLATNATWLAINAGTGVLTGTAVTGIYYVNVTVDDGNGGSDWSNFTLTAYADSNGNGIPDYRDPEFLTTIQYNNQTMWNNATLWNNQTIPEYHNSTVWANETVTVTNTETPMWAWGALIAAVVLGAVAAITVMKGGKRPKQVSGPKEAEPETPAQEPQPEN